MDETDILLILLSVFLFCMCWLGYMAENKRGDNKPLKRFRRKKTVDKADETDMYGNWMYPDLHREKEDRELRKWLNDFMR